MPSTISVLDSSNTPVTVNTLDAIAALVGEVQASPTSNTMLDRLKTLAGLVGEVQASPTANTLLDRLKTLAGLIAQIGEVQASPTANTVLDRLKTIATAVAAATPAGTNTIGAVSQAASASNGWTGSRVKAAAGTNATSLKGSAGVLHGYCLFNNTTTAKFVKIFDKATAPTAGSDTPAFTIIVPASGGANVTGLDMAFTSGLGYTVTGLVGDSDTTATAADDVTGVLLWK